jgi:hypothetical protein
MFNNVNVVFIFLKGPESLKPDPLPQREHFAAASTATDLTRGRHRLAVSGAPPIFFPPCL